MLPSITLLLVFQLAGEVISRLAHLPVPGPVIGMVLLFAMLVLRGKVSDELRDSAQQLLQHLSLLFIPAGVGVMLHVQRLKDEWWPLLFSLVISTALTLLVTAWILQIMQRKRSATGTES
jgi:holin-like protein